MIYNNLSCNPRSDFSFKQMMDEDHHNGESVLNDISIGLISQVPLDYMHLVCLGVTRKLLRMWVKGKLPHRLPSRDTLLISQRLISSSFQAQKYIVCGTLDEYPMDSSLLGIFVVEKLSDKFTIVLNFGDIVCTYFRMNLCEKVVCIPLLHTIK